MIINGKEIIAKNFAYDGCHKIYLIEDESDLKKAVEMGYNIYPINEIEDKYEHSCDLRFINNWKLTQSTVAQFEDAWFRQIKKGSTVESENPRMYLK